MIPQWLLKWITWIRIRTL